MDAIIDNDTPRRSHTYFENGKIWQEMTSSYEGGHERANITVYWNNGTKGAELSVLDGLMDGDQTIWWPNGVQKTNFRSKKGNPVEPRFVKFFDENGATMCVQDIRKNNSMSGKDCARAGTLPPTPDTRLP
jgi:antitoxin component YwqK of YwqJK toxin-antitoxin module